MTIQHFKAISFQRAFAMAILDPFESWLAHTLFAYGHFLLAGPLGAKYQGQENIYSFNTNICTLVCNLQGEKEEESPRFLNMQMESLLHD